jgi:hypothetical protein
MIKLLSLSKKMIKNLHSLENKFSKCSNLILNSLKSVEKISKNVISNLKKLILKMMKKKFPKLLPKKIHSSKWPANYQQLEMPSTNNINRLFKKNSMILIILFHSEKCFHKINKTSLSSKPVNKLPLKLDLLKNPKMPLKFKEN